MSDETTPKQTSSVQAAMVKQMRLMRPQERPNDALLEITTSKGVQHFLIPKAGLNDLAQKLMALTNGGASDQQN